MAAIVVFPVRKVSRCFQVRLVLLQLLCSAARVHFACPLRFLKERKEITEKFTAEQDVLLREAQEKHACELRLLQERHQQHILSLTAELEAKHRAEVEKLKASVESEQWALSEARVADLQTRHAAAVSALEARHSSHLDSLESRHLSEMQVMREEHRWALEQLRAELEQQLHKKDASHSSALTQEPEKHQLKHGRELPPVDHGLRTQMSTNHVEGVEALAPAELRGAQQVRQVSGQISSCRPPVCLCERVSCSAIRGDWGLPHGWLCGGWTGGWRCVGHMVGGRGDREGCVVGGRGCVQGRMVREDVSAPAVWSSSSCLCKAASPVVCLLHIGPRPAHPRLLPLIQGHSSA